MLKNGEPAPDFCLEASNGDKISLSDFKGKKVILYFYPKDNTPGCTAEACDFRDNQEVIGARNAVVLGISKDNLQSHQKFIDKYGLNFILLSDPEARVIKQYGAWGKKCGREGIIRSTFIINETGEIAEIYPKVKVPGHIEEILAAL